MAQYSLAPESDDDDDEEIVTTFSNDELEEDEGYKPVDINNGEQRIRVLRTRLPMLLRVLIFAIVLTIVHLLLFWVVKEWLRPYEYKKAPHVYDLVIYRATPAGRFFVRNCELMRCSLPKVRTRICICICI
jgi:hypothetical protein